MISETKGKIRFDGTDNHSTSFERVFSMSGFHLKIEKEMYILRRRWLTIDLRNSSGYSFDAVP